MVAGFVPPRLSVDQHLSTFLPLKQRLLDLVFLVPSFLRSTFEVWDSSLPYRVLGNLFQSHSGDGPSGSVGVVPRQYEL